MHSFDPVTLKYLDLSVELEQNAYKFYTTARDEVKDFNMKSLLNALMGNEIDHLETITRVRDLYAAKNTEQVKEAAETFEVHRPNNPFRDMKQVEKLKEPGADILDVFNKAVELEQKASDFYLEAAEHAELDFIKAYFKKLAAEEVFHKEFIESHREAICKDGFWLGINQSRLDHVTLKP